MIKKILLILATVLIIFISLYVRLDMLNNEDIENNNPIELKNEIIVYADTVNDDIVFKMPKNKVIHHTPANQDMMYAKKENKKNIENKNNKTDVDGLNTNAEDTNRICDVGIDYTTYSIPENTGFKSYMDYKYITSSNSFQYKLQTLYAYTGDYGIRMVDDRYCIAIGTYFGVNVGQYLDLILENGTVIPCVLSDIKADIHTDETNIVTLLNGCVSEFVIDTDYLDTTAKKMGDISYCMDEWKSTVVQIKIYNKNIFAE